VLLTIRVFHGLTINIKPKAYDYLLDSSIILYIIIYFLLNILINHISLKYRIYYFIYKHNHNKYLMLEYIVRMNTMIINAY
jgi:hypothetical protein